MAKKTLKTDKIPVTEVEEVDGVFQESDKTQEIIDKANVDPKKETTTILQGVEGINSLAELTPEQKEKVEQYKQSLDIDDVTSIIEYGIQEQEGLKGVVDSISRTSKSKEVEVIGNDLMNLRSTLRKQGESQTGGKFAALVRRVKDKVLTKRDGNMSLNDNIEAIEKVVVNHIDILTNDIESLDDLWEINKSRFYDLELLRKAGKEKIEEMSALVDAKRREFEESDGVLDEMEKQTLAKMDKSVKLLEKKLYDLYQSQILAVQTAAQIHMIKSNDIQLKELMQESVLTVIPIRQMQGALSAATQDAQSVANLHKSMSDATNMMLRKNAEMLGTLSVDVATEAEKPVIENETLKQVFITIGQTIDKVAKIAAEGQKQRIEGQKDLELLEQKTFGSSKQIEESKGNKKGK